MNTREIYIERLKEDLLGPTSPVEILAGEPPSERYLTGAIFPAGSKIEADQNDKAEQDEDGLEESADNSSAPIHRQVKPGSFGISFRVLPNTKFAIQVTGGIYEPEGDSEDYVRNWRRRTFTMSKTFSIDGAEPSFDPYVEEFISIQLRIRKSKAGDFLVTALCRNKAIPSIQKKQNESKTLFQAKMEISLLEGKFQSIGSTQNSSDRDTVVNNLLYRKVLKFATGHGCSADWVLNENRECNLLKTDFMPHQFVYRMDANGDKVFLADQKIRSAKFLLEATESELIEGLFNFIKSYEGWINAEQEKASDFQGEWKHTATSNIEYARASILRMNLAVTAMKNDESILAAFRNSVAAMSLSNDWAGSTRPPLVWRPFQLGFFLQCMISVIDENSDDRNTMDLLWFPTGGGKTEAYLWLVLFLLFKRNSSKSNFDKGGVSVLMRYTLRLLTVQQFQRAASSILAGEVIRQEKGFGGSPFTIGLWVGGGLTPNNNTVESHQKADAKQIKKCPCCKQNLIWPAYGVEPYNPTCSNESCQISKIGSLGVYTVDTDIYNKCPSLVIATIDKLAQVVFDQNSSRLFGIDTNYRGPDLVIQDELHLISGPLGSMAGLYETGLDNLMSKNNGKRPKVIGSTATITRAEQQVTALFNREVRQFPPPIIDHDNSCFAVVDNDINKARLYLGVSSAGLSPKYLFQATVGSVSQSVIDKRIADSEKDSYFTLVAYFNALRELGGSLVLFYDDIPATIGIIARRRSEEPRIMEEHSELTSRKSGDEIQSAFQQLDTKFDGTANCSALDVLYATNMLSVGVDIARMAAMIVNGQPKTISEYIQATSRPGRDKIPGLIITQFNASKPRDRAYFEDFKAIHQSLYRFVEGGSITPFSSRAVNRGIHAIVIMVLRYGIKELRNTPATINSVDPLSIKYLVDQIKEHVASVDKNNCYQVNQQIDQVVDMWKRKAEAYPDLTYLGNPNAHNCLICRAETSAAMDRDNDEGDLPLATPGSLRNVEANVYFAKYSNGGVN